MKKRVVFTVLGSLLWLSCGNNHDMMYSPEYQYPSYTKDMQVPTGERGETFKEIKENPFVEVSSQPVSTFSVDVDRAAYSNIRRMIQQGTLPPKDAVRIEEMINYFDYDYPTPDAQTPSPLRVSYEQAPAPWNTTHYLLRIGLKTKPLDLSNTPASHLVFLIDVSGSMMDYNKLPLLKSSLKLLLQNLKPQDKVSIVTYASGTQVALEPTSVREREKIEKVLDELEAGGATSGERGIQLAYELAHKAFIEKQREGGVYLSVLGFGMGNYRDDMSETLADSGNGNYAYIDNLTEAKKVLVNEFGGTLFTVANDVKLQIEFNPKYVKQYKLLGYENRMLANEDFTNDKKDAGEVGAGHTVTAIYEIVPSDGKVTSSLRYQDSQLNEIGKGNEVAFLKIRYKDPKEANAASREVVEPLIFNLKKLSETSEDFRFATAVAEFGLLLRDSEYKAQASYDQVIELAKNAFGRDEEGYRKEFVRLVEGAKLMAKNK